MKFEVTTKADVEMGNGSVTIDADTPAAAAQKYGLLRAVDYFGDDADAHVGALETIMVQEAGMGTIHEITVEYV